MDVLLDTCCLIWAASDPDRLTSRVAELLQAVDTRVAVSAISCAELACLTDRGRVELDCHWRTWFDTVIADNEWAVLPIDLRTIQEAFSLPGEFHRDPADRIITGTARLRDMAVLTADRKILDYPHVESIWDS